jgi:hypothetical protein
MLNNLPTDLSTESVDNPGTPLSPDAVPQNNAHRGPFEHDEKRGETADSMQGVAGRKIEKSHALMGFPN